MRATVRLDPGVRLQMLLPWEESDAGKSDEMNPNESPANDHDEQKEIENSEAQPEAKVKSVSE